MRASKSVAREKRLNALRRKAKRVSIEALAKASGVDRRSIERFRAGGSIRVQTERAFASVLNVKTGDAIYVDGRDFQGDPLKLLNEYYHIDGTTKKAITQKDRSDIRDALCIDQSVMAYEGPSGYADLALSQFARAQRLVCARKSAGLEWEELETAELVALSKPLRGLFSLKPDWDTSNAGRQACLRVAILNKIEDIECGRIGISLGKAPNRKLFDEALNSLRDCFHNWMDSKPGGVSGEWSGRTTWGAIFGEQPCGWGTVTS